MRGMGQKELAFRIAFEILLLVLVLVALRAMVSVSWPAAIVISVITGHTANWLFNGHVWVCLRYCAFYRRKTVALRNFLSRTESLLARLTWVEEAVYIGSVGETGDIQSTRSDIDLRLIFAEGAGNWLRTNLLLLRLRTEALFRAIPLDLYAYDTPQALLVFREDEGRLLIKDAHGRLGLLFADRETRRAVPPDERRA